ncbi:hypothetical protein J1G43_06740 [Cellulomonas sp. zg-ZUI22]|uniref:hypothetical protein n=1 Tax=Cellulomonas sp. zg-ZUI22 TaxID=2816955 RepID=UPI001A947441|nr:hypothetical protein [Cellulomonas sp. zg-ZUI22]MBO0899657.1 hypothetical protein [Cellulomonas sp. zg-ZUI22]
MAGVVLALVVPPGVAVAASGDGLVTTWDGPTVDLAWDGLPATASSATFSGAPVVVPGGVQGRTITVTNAGPTDAVLRGWVQDVQLLDPDADADDADLADGAPGADFYTDLTLTWRTASGDGRSSFRRLATAGATPVVDVLLARGASTQVTVVTALATDATSGNRANVPPREATYEVLLRLDGSTWARAGAASRSGSAGTDVDAVTPRVDTIVTIAEVQAAGGAGAGPLAHTVLHGLRAALLAVIGIGVGSLLLGAARRRRDARDAGASRPAPPAR